MKYLGHIEISDKVIFVYYALPLPRGQFCGENDDEPLDDEGLSKAMKKYEASKREVEVSNVFWWSEFKVWTFTSRSYSELDGKKVIDNKPCEAEVNGKATIVKIL